ncbi:hypothetical protein [Burkholderia stagnalis]|uniref:hypothetical protein n=1 Tax=Burkholderia stagnalis TaxID=1503054 RepID=UPI000A99E687|nr:hypothetical protein [Burkholderia stagnalis]MDY7806677.1 hypothetical protein [Burkholderia stagnalis]
MELATKTRQTSKWVVVCSLAMVAVAALATWLGRWHESKEGAIDYEIVSTREPTILTLTPERRTVLVVPSAFNGANSGLRTCPEPPPDVAEALTTAVAAQLKADVGTHGDAASRVSKSLGSAVSQLFYRTQGAGLFRDGTHALCLAWLNDIYKTNDLSAWRADFRYLLDVSGQLIHDEVETRGRTDAVASDGAQAQAVVPAGAAWVTVEPSRHGKEGRHGRRSHNDRVDSGAAAAGGERLGERQAPDSPASEAGVSSSDASQGQDGSPVKRAEPGGEAGASGATGNLE